MAALDSKSGGQRSLSSELRRSQRLANRGGGGGETIRRRKVRKGSDGKGGEVSSASPFCGG